MPPFLTPENTRIYAIGDIHGRADQLQCLLQKIKDDGADYAGEVVYVFLGDYIDRGHQSRQVIDTLLDFKSRTSAPCYFLKGNHEDMLQAFWAGDTASWSWLNLRGGAAFMGSYGIQVRMTAALDALRQDLDDKMPPAHKAFFENLQTRPVILGDYLFIHAGFKPGVPLAAQSETDMCWMRGFMQTPHDFNYFIVVGHTPDAQPVVTENAMCIDTACGQGGPLTCVVLERATHRFLQAEAMPKFY